MSSTPVSLNHTTYLPTSSTCFVCGEDNHAGLKVRFYVEDGVVKTRFYAQPHHCGYEGVVHGGVSASVLDECLGWAAAYACNRMCVTAELTIRYRRRVPCECDMTILTEVTKTTKRLIYVQGSMVDKDGVVYVTAEGAFSPLSIEETLYVDDNMRYRAGDMHVFDELRTESLQATDCEQHLARQTDHQP